MTDVSPTRWRKSTHSATGNDTCIEVAGLPGTVAVRDSTDPNGPMLTFTPPEWKAFTQRLASGDRKE
jgi:hypothetical protein